ncbi:MAG TPA: DUF5666 domain-containing protein [Friedmanniella sp.]
MKKPALLIASAVSAVALAGAVGVGVASADPTPSPTPSVSASPSAGSTAAADHAKNAKARHGLFARALHGEVVLGGKKHRVVDFQRGTVTAVSTTSITVKSADDFTATYVVDAKTKVRHDQAPAAIGAVKTGDRVRVVAQKDGGTVTAKRIADRTK